MIQSFRSWKGIRRRLPTRDEVLDGGVRFAEEAALRWRMMDHPRATGALLGLAAPLVVFGNAVLGLLFGLAAIAAAPGLKDRILRWRLRGLALTPAGGLGIATALWWTATCLFSLDPWGSAEVVLRITLFVLAACLIVAVLAERIDARRLAEMLFVSAFAACTGLAAIAMYADDGLLRLFAPFTRDLTDSVTFFKSYTSVMAVATPVALWIGWRRGGWLLAAALSGLIAGAFLVWGDGSQIGRAGLVGLAAALAVVVFARALRDVAPVVRRSAAALLVAAGLALGGLVTALLPASPITQETAENPPLPVIDLHRQAIWGFVFDKALERPILGFGVNTINTAPGAKDEVLNLNQEYVPSHPHNWVLEVLSETGFPGLLLLLASQLALGFAFARRALMGRAGGYALLAALAGFWVSSLANFSIWSAWWQVTFLACLALPAARLMGPEIAEREADAAPRLDRRRLSLIALAALLTLMLVLVWYARRTEEGYILYKRLGAESPYVYDEIRPERLAVDPAALIDPTAPADVAALRTALSRAIWGEEAPPRDLQPAEVEALEAAPYDFDPNGTLVAAAERFRVPIEGNYTAVGYIFRAAEPSGRAVVYQHGYAGDIHQAAPLIRSFLEQGVTVAALNFPGYAENAFRTDDHPQFGPVDYDNDFLLYFMERPMRAYIEPAIVAANRLRAAHGVEETSIVGFSAGGWVAGVAAAVDPRFAKSASVASYLPLYLRDRRNPGEWPPPHLYAPLIQAANYLEIPLLAAAGEGRRYLQVFNRYDRCCYMNRRGAVIQPAVSDRLDALGLGGAFGVAIDETHARHQISDWARARLIAFLQTGELREDERWSAEDFED